VLDEASEEVAFYKAEVVLGEQEELSDEKETDENNLEPLGYQIEDVISKDVAEEWPIELAEDIAGDEQPLIYTVENKSDPAIRVEEAGREIPAESYSTDDEVENTLIALMEYIETSDAETAETVNEILDKIIELGVKLEGEITEITPAEVEVQEELEELFIELLDTLGMDYSMESIETLARMIVEWQPNDIEELDMYELEGLLNDSGTHEAIKQLLAGLGNRKNASMPIFVIGRSALQLYSFDSRSTAGVA
jgi:hypothetical protein